MQKTKQIFEAGVNEALIVQAIKREKSLDENIYKMLHVPNGTIMATIHVNADLPYNYVMNAWHCMTWIFRIACRHSV